MSIQQVKNCYNCGKKLILDFYWIVISKQTPDAQYLGEDFGPVPPDDPNYEEIEFEVCKHCWAAQ